MYWIFSQIALSKTSWSKFKIPLAHIPIKLLHLFGKSHLDFHFSNMAQTKTKRNKSNALHCEICAYNGLPADHKFDKQHCYCHYCNKTGHHMSLCYKLKFCNLCGKAGHNPFRCWTYYSIWDLINKAWERKLCLDCLRPWKPRTANGVSYHDCGYCRGADSKHLFLDFA